MCSQCVQTSQDIGAMSINDNDVRITKDDEDGGGTIEFKVKPSRKERDEARTSDHVKERKKLRRSAHAIAPNVEKKRPGKRPRKP